MRAARADVPGGKPWPHTIQTTPPGDPWGNVFVLGCLAIFTCTMAVGIWAFVQAFMTRACS